MAHAKLRVGEVDDERFRIAHAVTFSGFQNVPVYRDFARPLAAALLKWADEADAEVAARVAASGVSTEGQT